jgi:hypothetical protein
MAKEEQLYFSVVFKEMLLSADMKNMLKGEKIKHISVNNKTT